MDILYFDKKNRTSTLEKKNIYIYQKKKMKHQLSDKHTVTYKKILGNLLNKGGHMTRVPSLHQH